MTFYVWDTPEVAKHFKSEFYSSSFYVVSNHDYPIKIDMMLPGSVGMLNLLKSEGIPEYKLHPKHGLIPADSKLFKEDIDKEQEVKQMKEQDTKKVFEVGDKCIIKNIDNNFPVSADVYENFVDQEVTVVAKFAIPSDKENSFVDMVSVMNEVNYCTCLPESMCYPVKTEKEKAIEEIENILTSVKCISPDRMETWEIANKLYGAGYRKVEV